MTGTVNVCIAMGSNMGDRLKHLQMASEQLGDLPDTTLTACSQWLETDPVGPIEQGAFLNGAAVIQTKLSAGDLLAKLNAIEHEHGRQDQATRVKWGPRPLDLDIIFYGDQIIDQPGLIVPHPLMHERSFVLQPLSEIASDWVHPKLGLTVKQLLANVKS
ncbi:MAG: 2-amino-4-hydroxy-6-hydroxymethyldihydropteridine diphosphokinase [Phycisphaeraceae bacterium]|nr:2-amino-4-hydroxy-6-hydroxymethyldihydropteridine diphosphokinase [Phycisphaeraceae bacterium]